MLSMHSWSSKLCRRTSSCQAALAPTSEANEANHNNNNNNNINNNTSNNNTSMKHGSAPKENCP